MEFVTSRGARALVYEDMFIISTGGVGMVASFGDVRRIEVVVNQLRV